ncbi:MAG: AMP-binding protein [Oscillospiraceae bacterium]|nr:AMP-binding protein [Oscillospiraceae bacterium]
MKPKRTLFEPEYLKDLREVLNKPVREYPDNNAFIVKIKKGKESTYRYITYKEFQQNINELGTALIDLGYKGKKIAVIGKNRYEWAVGYLATLNGVGITVPLDKGLPEEEIEGLLERAKVDVLIFEKEYEQVAKKISEKKGNTVKEFISMDPETDSKFTTMEKMLVKGRELIASGDRRFIDSEIDEDAVCAIVFTSGTTSMAKGAMLTHKNYASNIYAINHMAPFKSTDVNMAFLPFHHTLGSTGLMVMLAQGMTNVFCDGIKYIQPNLKEYKVSVFVCVPLLLEAMYKKIMAEVDRQGKTKLMATMSKVCNFLLKFKIDIRRKVFKKVLDNLGGEIRFIISGAAPIDKNVAEGFANFGMLSVQGYGLTETAPVLAAENPTAIRYGSCGFPMVNVDLKIDNPNEEGIGEIIAKGPNVMVGYYENQEATDEVIKNGWFHTGDLGRIDEDGFVFITGRKKNVIVLKNGKNIYPEEIEMHVSALPYVQENMVYGKPKGDDLLLSVKIVYNEEYTKEKYPGKTEEELHDIIWKDIKEINDHLPTYKRMKHLVVTNEEMVKTTTRKVKRFEEMKKEAE